MRSSCSLRDATLKIGLLAHHADVAELADALDLGSSARKGVGVQVSPSAPMQLAVLLIIANNSVKGLDYCKMDISRKELGHELRDKFAAAALTGLLIHLPAATAVFAARPDKQTEEIAHERLAIEAYRWADAMLKVRDAS